MDLATPTVVVDQSSPKRRFNLLQVLWFAAGAALLIAGGVYTLRYLSATSFDQQRAFRALDEMAGQLDNLQGALAGLLRLMKDDLFTDCARSWPEPKTLSPEQDKKKSSCVDTELSYKKRLAIRGVEPGVVMVDERVRARACSGDAESLFVLRTRQPEVPSVAIRCKEAKGAADTGAIPVPPGTQSIQVYGLKGSLTEIVAGFVSQSYFDEALLALRDGTVIASVPGSDRSANDSRRSLHPARITQLNITDATELLHDHVDAATGDPAPNPATASAPAGQPITFAYRIAGQLYQVFVRPMRPKYPIYADDQVAPLATQQEIVYLVGLKRADLRGDITASLGPGGRFWLTLTFLLALFIWPLASVKSKSARDAISWSDLVACLFSLIFIPATLAIGAVWCWGYVALERWADRGAAAYAQSIDGYLRAELGQDLTLLRAYREGRGASVKSNGCGWEQSASPLPISATVTASGLTKDGADTCRLVGPGPTLSWSPLQSVFATTSEGIRDGGLSAFDPSIVRPDAPYGARQYFQALRLNQGWVAPDINGAEQFVAQRIFSAGDGSRLLQLAIRRKCPAGAGAATFCGIVSGGSRVHGLSAAVLPPLLQFAVIDRNTGSVLFHADERRSLAENLFVETEQNAALRAAASVNRSAYFNGRYLGENHRFVYLPMREVPWGIVVMYSVRELGGLSWHAGLTALVAYAGFVLILAVILTLFFSLRARWSDAAGNPARILWPHEPHAPVAGRFLVKVWHRTCFYERCGIFFFGFVVLIVMIYELAVPHRISPLTYAMLALWLVALALIVRQRRRDPQPTSSAGEPVRSVARQVPCLTLGLILVSVLPVVWMSLAYNDAQIQGLIRDGLVGASHDVERRYDIIATDLRRWRATTLAGNFSDAWDRTGPSVTPALPGFSAGACGKSDANSNVWALCVFEPPPLSGTIVTRALDFWRRETWKAAAPSQDQLRRIGLLMEQKAQVGMDPQAQVDTNPRCSGLADPPPEDRSAQQLSAAWTRCKFAGGDGHTFWVAAGSMQSAASAATAKTLSPDDEKFAGVMQAVFTALPAALVILFTTMCASFASRRLFGGELDQQAADSEQQATRRIVYYSPKIADLDACLGVDASRRINLAYGSTDTFKQPRQTYVLDDLDLALGDASRRSYILSWLEELARSDAELIITSRHSVLDRLDNPGAFGAHPAAAVIPQTELRRWHALLELGSLSSSIKCVPNARGGKSAAICFRERWELYTREERVLLHQIAAGALVNPLNRGLIERLARHGDIKFDPWPKIDDAHFVAFIKRMGTEPAMTELLQSSAARSSSTRRTVVGILLVIVLVLVVWFSWAAGDQFKIVSAILAGSLAFLGQISQAFSFVRGAGQSGK